MTDRARTVWTFTITSVALFMVALDNLVVTTALPVIKHDLDASLSGLEWTVNAYTLTYAVLLLTGAALGDRYGRRRVFVIGMVIFVAGSAAAALAPGIGSLIVARAMQGVGGAIVTPLSLTIMSAAMPRERRGLALGAQGGVSGFGVAIGPLVGGAVVQGLSWQWIFWINVPIGLVLLPLAIIWLKETTGPRLSLDLPGLGLASAGLFGIVFGLVRGSEHGWTNLGVVGWLIVGSALLVGFVVREMTAPAPMVPMRFFRDWPFSGANLTSLLLFFGLFGSVFLLAQFFQIVQGYSPLQAGLRILPWTAAPILVAPIAGILSDRIGSRPLLVSGMALMSAGLAWLAAITTPTVAYLDMVTPFVLAGVGMSLMFAPISNVVLSAVTREEEGKASGVNNTVREIGGVFGVAVLATVFAAAGSYTTPQTFVNGLTAAVWVGATVVGLGALAALTVPGRRRSDPQRDRTPTADEPAATEAHKVVEAPGPPSPPFQGRAPHR
jgi:EmrB/QacA subfamily drug resistance transporter